MEPIPSCDLTLNGLVRGRSIEAPTTAFAVLKSRLESRFRLANRTLHGGPLKRSTHDYTRARRPMPRTTISGSLQRAADGSVGHAQRVAEPPTRRPQPPCGAARGLERRERPRRPRNAEWRHPGKGCRHQGAYSSRANSVIRFGTAASNPAMSSMPASVGSAMLNAVAVMPTTTSLAGIPVCSR